METNGELYPIIRRFLLYFRCFFCASMTLDDNNTLRVNAFENWAQAIMTTFAGCFLFKRMLDTLRGLSLDNPYQTLSRMQYTEVIMLTLIVFYQWRRHNAKLKSVFERIKAIDDVVKPSKEQERHFRRKTTEWMVLYAFGFLCYVTTLGDLKGSAWTLIIKFFRISWHISQAILPDLMHWMLVTLSGYYIECMNRELKKMSKTTRLGTTNERDRSERVRQLREVLRQIDLITEDMDQVFGYRLVVSMLHIHVDFIYIILVNLTLVRYVRGPMTNELASGIIHNNAEIFFQGFRLFEVLKIGSKFAENGRKTPIVVHQLLAEEMDDSSKKELAIFSLVLLHRKNEIWAKGFDLDYTFIPIVISGTVMHIMVLLQFNLPGYENGIKPFEDLIQNL